MSEFLWSPSQILRYRSCPRQWNELRGGGVRSPGPPKPYRAVGIAVHAGLSTAYREAALATGHRGGQVMSLFSELALEALDAEWARLYPGLDDPEWTEQSPEEATLLRYYHNEAVTTLVLTLTRLPVPQPSAVLAVERRMVIESVTGFREQVIPDLVLRTGQDSAHVRDWKRTKVNKLPRAAELHAHDQLGPYSLAVRQVLPGVRKITVGLYSTTSRREVVAEMPAEAAEHVLDIHEEIARAAESAVHYPATPDGYNCSGCPVRTGCPAWAQHDAKQGVVSPDQEA